MTLNTNDDGLFGIERTAFMAEFQKLTAKLSRVETTHGIGVNLIYLFLSKTQKQALLQIQHQQTARYILEDVPEDADELQWFAAVVSSALVQRQEWPASAVFDFLKKNKDQGESNFKSKMEIYVQERAAQRFPDDAKADYAVSDSIRYVAKKTIIEREQLDKIYYYLNHYHPTQVSLFTKATYKLKLLENPSKLIFRKISILRQALSQLNEAKINLDLEVRILSLKRLKESEIKVYIHLYDLLLYLGPHDPLHEMLQPILSKMSQYFQNMSADFYALHHKNMAKSGELNRRYVLDKIQDELHEKYTQLKQQHTQLMQDKEKLEKETVGYKKQKITQDTIQHLQQKISRLEKENAQLMDEYYYFKVKLLNIVPIDSEQEQTLNTAWQQYIEQKKPTANVDELFEEQSSFDTEEEPMAALSMQDFDDDLSDEPTKINLADISPAALKILNNRLDIQNQKLDEINQSLEQQNKMIEHRLQKLNELKSRYFESKEFDTELEKQSLESHRDILLKDKKRNTERLEELEWKFEKLFEIYDGDKTEIKAVLQEIERKHATGEHVHH